MRDRARQIEDVPAASSSFFSPSFLLTHGALKVSSERAETELGR